MRKVMHKAAKELLGSARDCFEMAKAQEESAQKQHENAARQHASADRQSDDAHHLRTLGSALESEAIDLEGETQLHPGSSDQRPKTPPGE